VQEQLLQNGVRHYHFAEVSVDSAEKQWAITDGRGYFPSTASRAVDEFHNSTAASKIQNGPDQLSEYNSIPLHELSLVDLAAITKVRNPWHPGSQILLIAGIRGIGTWGAAETMKKWYDLIYKQKKGWSLQEKSQKKGSFSALLEIHYRNSDITKAEVVGFIDIDD
jgi:hypothetical protein